MFLPDSLDINLGQETYSKPVVLEPSDDPKNLRELLVYPSAFGWHDSDYYESKLDYVNSPPHLDSVSINYPILRMGKGYCHNCGMYAQNVRIYRNEIDAESAYQIERKYMINGYSPPNGDKVADITRNCSKEMVVSDRRCNIIIQHGIYLVDGFMYMDGDNFTGEHWDRFTDAMQDKLIEQN